MKFKKSVSKACLCLIFLASLPSLGDDSQISELIKKSISYLKEEQKKDTIENDHYRGEWPSYIYNDEGLFMLGPLGKKAYDSNLFVTAVVHNSLATIYLNHKEFTEIPEMLSEAIASFDAYKEGETYGFWRKFQLEDRLKTKRMLRRHTQVEVRRPSIYHLESKFINGAANVPNDADDTAAVFTAFKLQQKLKEQSTPPEAEANDSIELPKIGKHFSSYRDRHRMNVHYYNLAYGNHVRTGAFLTWLGKEHFFLTGIAPSKKFKKYIPYGANEVDCVVNANVLATLASYNELNTPGVEDACQFVNLAVKRREFDRCGVYYPNRFHVHYSVLKAIHAGATCLNESVSTIIEDLIEKQAEDGTFSSPALHDKLQNWGDKINNKLLAKEEKKTHAKPMPENLVGIDTEDRMQATLYAVHAAILAGAPDSLIQKSIDYLVSKAQVNESSAHWQGGVFFAGGTLIRNAMRWRSDAYTTALMAETLSLYLDKKAMPSNSELK